MPQYKLIYRDAEGDHEFVRYGENEDDAKNFTPQRLDEDFSVVPFDCDFVSAEEMDVWAWFQLEPSNYEAVKQTALEAGLQVQKGVGAFCLEVKGKGDWMLSEWTQGLKVLSSTWIKRG